MKYVEFYFSNKAEGRVVLDNGKITYEDLPDKLVEELEHGIYNDKKSEDNKPYFTLPDKEPENFLKSLVREYSGSYVRASEVKDG